MSFTGASNILQLSEREIDPRGLTPKLRFPQALTKIYFTNTNTGKSTQALTIHVQNARSAQI